MPEETKPNGTPPESPQPAVTPAAKASPNPAQPTAKAAATAAAAAPQAAPAAAAPKPAAAPPKPAGPVPEPWNTELTAELKRLYGSGIREASTYLGQSYLTVDCSIVKEILSRMRDDEGFDYCVDLTAVNYPKRTGAEFEVVYILYSFAKNTRVRVKTQIADGASMPSVVDIWPTANWLEREVFDMFGIRFDGHPDLKRILLPDGWNGHPLRKDYSILQQDNDWVQINLGIKTGGIESGQ